MSDSTAPTKADPVEKPMEFERARRVTERQNSQGNVGQHEDFDELLKNAGPATRLLLSDLPADLSCRKADRNA